MRSPTAVRSTIESPTTPTPGRLRGIGSYAIRALLGIAILSFVLSRLNRHLLWQLISREKPSYFLAAGLIYLLGQMVAAARWQLLASLVGILARYSDCLLYFFIGAFTNLFIPGLVGGDATRAIYLGRRYHALGRAIASVLADRLIGLLALVWVATVAVATLGRGVLPTAVTTPVLIVGTASVVSYLLLPAIHAITRYLPARVRATSAILEPYLRGRLAMVPAIALASVLHLLQVIAQYVLALGLGLTLPFRLFLLCVPLTNVLASMPITIGGLGVREGLYVVLFGILGAGKADAAANGLLWFAVVTVVGICESLAFVLAPTPLQQESSKLASL
ncbi:MAG TPA: lysylphosphatidylglycerol synthase transmembrane domain-containing protein [Candidatus Binataceae bacterium]|nr:lysylphosphatidylglycerol synthase transmembrane domain-containing protein [Candidatus Binataceae bacterium]